MFGYRSAPNNAADTPQIITTHPLEIRFNPGVYRKIQLNTMEIAITITIGLDFLAGGSFEIEKLLFEK